MEWLLATWRFFSWISKGVRRNHPNHCYRRRAFENAYNWYPEGLLIGPDHLKNAESIRMAQILFVSTR